VPLVPPEIKTQIREDVMKGCDYVSNELMKDLKPHEVILITLASVLLNYLLIQIIDFVISLTF